MTTITESMLRPNLLTRVIPPLEVVNKLEQLAQDRLSELYTLTSTANGSTGFTFIGTTTMDEKIVREVLKWQNKAFSKNERMTTNLMKEFGFQVPSIDKISRKNPPRALIARANEQRPCLPISPTKKSEKYRLSLTVMDCLPGSNFEQTVKKGDFFKVSPEDRRAIFRSFGQVSVFDVFLGNDDRIVRLEGERLKSTPSMNSGNVMIETVSDGTQLRDVYYIDSTSQILDLPIPQDSTTESFDDAAACLFGEETELPCDLPNGDEQDAAPSKVEIQQANFANVLKICLDDNDSFVQHVYFSVSNAVKEALPPSQSQNLSILEGEKEELLQAVKEGVDAGVSELRRIVDQNPPFLSLVGLNQNFELIKQRSVL